MQAEGSIPATSTQAALLEHRLVRAVASSAGVVSPSSAAVLHGLGSTAAVALSGPVHLDEGSEGCGRFVAGDARRGDLD